MRNLCAFALLLVVASSLTTGLASPRAAQADVDKAQKQLLQGDYKAAERTLSEDKSKSNALARSLVAIELDLIQGRYQEAEKKAGKLEKTNDPELAQQSAIAHSKALAAVGKYKASHKVLLDEFKKSPDAFSIRHAVGRSYERIGKATDAAKIWNQFFDDFEADKMDKNNALHLFYVAEAARFLGSYRDAADLYQEAAEIDTSLHLANIELGHAFMEKYAPGDAEETFEEVLKVNPKHPDALAGIAANRVGGSSYDAKGAHEFIAKTLEINPNHAGALVTRAGLHIDRNRWDDAKKALHTALQANPEDLDVRATLATIYWLKDEMQKYQAEKKRVLGHNPRYSRFFHIVMRSAEREHRYAQGVELGKEAVAINDKDYEAMQLVASGLLRLGEEKEAMPWLRRAWSGDEYNARTLNTLELFEKFIPRNYEFVTSKNFKIRYHKDEKEVLHRYITPKMEVAFADMIKRYGYTPKTPLILELYQSAEHYSVRTVGLPNLGALGVCFGQVVTAMSPTVGEINWGMVMWHELSHVFAIQLSNSRVPRWFTEGLSEYETIRRRPEWRRENDADLWTAMKTNTLPSVAELNDGFMGPGMQDVLVAYHLSSVTIEYIVAEYGFPAVVKALKLFGKGQETVEVIESITGKPVAQFDKEFREHLTRRLAPYKKNLILPEPTQLGSVKENQEKVKASPKNAEAHARLAMALSYAGKFKAALAAAEAALAIDPAQAMAHYVAAELYGQARKAEKAKEHFEAVLKSGAESPDVRLRLANLEREKNEAAFVAHLESIKHATPELAAPYINLAEYYEEKGQDDKALKELETFVMIEQMDIGPLMKLMKGYADKKDWNKVVRYGELAILINPTLGQLQLQLGAAYQKVGRHADALFAFDTALLVKPRLRRPALAHVGRARALAALGKKKEAKSAVKDALDLEQDNAEALELQKSLGK